MLSEENTRFLILVAGQPGAGVGSAVKSLEDRGFYCIDNLPSKLIVPVSNVLFESCRNYCGLVLGVRLSCFEEINFLFTVKESLKSQAKVELLCLKANEDVLLSRYLTTRRKHPNVTAEVSLEKAVREGGGLFQRLEEGSDHCVDTSYLSPNQLGCILEKRYRDFHEPRVLNVVITSFGFKHGPFLGADSSFDVRFLLNPYFDPRLRSLTGLDQGVKEHVSSDDNFQPFIERLVGWNRWLLPKYYEEGKHYFRIAIGCTGGVHRSVFVAEHLCQALEAEMKEEYNFIVSHRELV